MPALRGALDELVEALLGGLGGPRRDGALADGHARVGHDALAADGDGGAVAGAGLAGAQRVVEAEELRRGARHGAAAVGAVELVAEAQGLGGVLVADHVDVAPPATELVAGLDGLQEPLARLRPDHQPVHHHLRVRAGLDLLALPLRADVDHLLPRQQPHEAHLPQPAKLLGDGLAVGEADGEGDHEAGALGQLQHLVGDAVGGVGDDLTPALGAVHVADARPEQAQVVVQLRGGADGRAAILDRVLLLDGDGGRDVLDPVDVRLVHALQELAGVGAEGLDVAALALGVEGVEGEGGLAAAADARHDDVAVAGDVDVDVLEIVHPHAAGADGVVCRSVHSALQWSRAGVAQTAHCSTAGKQMRSAGFGMRDGRPRRLRPRSRPRRRAAGP